MQNKVSDGLFYNEVYLIASDSMELGYPYFSVNHGIPSVPSHAFHWQIKNRTADYRAVLLFV